MHILLVGSGNMAHAITQACQERNIQCSKLENPDVVTWIKYQKDTPIAIHVGSGRQLHYLIDVCEELHSPIIQGSTQLSEPLPDNRKVTIINAPNLSLPIIRFLAAFPAFAKEIKPGMKLRITESHQRKKKDTSGTARAVARALNIPESDITSIRNPDIQALLGVPPEHLDGHAHHTFTFSGQGSEIVVSTRIHGRATYAEGALTLAQALANQTIPMGNGNYELKDILHLLPKD